MSRVDLKDSAVTKLGDDEVNEGLIWITYNLWTALRRLRLNDRSRLLWVDAVCINQSDDDEKSSQVRMMGDIYRGAARVLRWLGRADNQNIGALEDFIEAILASKRLKHSANDLRPYGQLSRENINAYKIPPTTSVSHPREYTGFWYVASNPYFRTLWIIQEVALAKKALLFCDYWYITWESFVEAFDFLYKELNLFGSWETRGANNFIYPLSSTATRISSKATPPLLHLIYIHDHSRASDPRDKVFGLKGLAADAADVEINYTKTTEQVYRDTALSLMMASENLDFLSVSPCYYNSVLPTWAADWRVPRTALLMYSDDKDFGFCASNDSRYTPVISEDGTRLQLLGLELDSIKVIGLSMSAYPSEEQSAERQIWTLIEDEITWAEWADICLAFADQHGLGYGTTGEAAMVVEHNFFFLRPKVG
jgi:hypothetical protein